MATEPIVDDYSEEDYEGDEGTRWVAQPKQNLALVDYEYIDDLFYGGAAGGGKTDYLLAFQAIRRLTYPGSKGLIVRLSFTDLSKSGSTIDRFLELFGREGKYDNNLHKFRWSNGSVTEFGYCASEQDKLHYQGAQYDDISFDEATQLLEEWVTYIAARARVRSRRLAKMGMKSKVRMCANPGGVGHGWAYGQYVSLGDCNPTEYVVPGTNIVRTKVFISAKVDDNLELLATDPAYKARLAGIKNDAERRAMLDGDWEVFDGQVFTELRDYVHLTDVRRVPAHWPRYIGFDWGWASPWVAIWLAQDPDTRRVVAYRRLSGTKMTDTEIAKTIGLASAGERIYAMFADPSIWNTRDGESTAGKFLATVEFQGIHLEPADNDRLNGLRRVHEYLHWAGEEGEGGAIDQSPMLLFSRAVEPAYKAIKRLIYDKIKVEDVDTKIDDHDYDALRYCLMGVGEVVELAPLRTIVLLPGR